MLALGAAAMLPPKAGLRGLFGAPRGVHCAGVSEPTPPAAPPRAPTLRVERLVRRYGDLLAVDQLSFDLYPGEILGLVGANGAGKTSTLRTVAGVLPIQSGRILVAGHDLGREELAAKRLLAWVPDDPQPFDALTVEEHLRFTAELYRVRDPWPLAESLLERFELSHKRAALGGELSRGMRQKLAFCCAFLSQPRLVLLDEPLSGLDPRGIRAAREAILEQARAGVAVLLSSHQLELVEALATRLLILDRGRARFDGPLEQGLAQVSAGSLEDLYFALTAEGQGRGEGAATPAPEPGG